MGDWKAERLRHHAHDRGLLDAEPNRSAHDAGIAEESPLPQGVTDDGHGRRAHRLIAFDERSTEQRRDTSDSKSGGRHLRDRDRLDITIDGQVLLGERHCAEVVDPLKLIEPGSEICVAQRPGTVSARVPVAKSDNAAALVQWEGGIEELGAKLEAADAGRNAERDPETADERQERVFDEHPQGELEVEERLMVIVRRSPVCLRHT
jgi:hypothetical protein